MLRRPAVVLTLVAVLLGATAGVGEAAGDPTMDLSQVRPGMRCTAASVVRGTAISTFDVEIVDVLEGDAAARTPYILFRASGPAVDATGLGPGFSGTPISCPGPDGVSRVVGAISESIGQYGGFEALATPIASILGTPVDAPAAKARTAAARARGARIRASARSLLEPLSFSGLSPAVAAVVRDAGRRAGRVVTTGPAAPRAASFAPQVLRPGSAVAVGLAGGDLTAGAVGTVSYVDGDRVWLFGHPLDGAGARSLLLQDAYVYDVIANPVGSEELSTYKLAAPGHGLGTVTYDGISAVTGRIGPRAPVIPMTLTAVDDDTGARQVAHVEVADEAALGQPTGTSALAQVGPVAVAQMAYNALDSSPARQSGSMCVRFALAGHPPLGFCNDYVGGGGGEQAVGGGPMVADMAEAIAKLDLYRFGPLRLAGVSVQLHLHRSLDQAYLLGVTGPKVLRRGRTASFTLRLRRVDGGATTRRVRVRVPLGLPAGRRDLVLTGTAADASASVSDALAAILQLDPGGAGGDRPGPTDLRELGKAVAGVHRYSGVTASFPRVGAQEGGATGRVANRKRHVLRDPALRISGSARTPVRIL